MTLLRRIDINVDGQWQQVRMEDLKPEDHIRMYGDDTDASTVMEMVVTSDPAEVDGIWGCNCRPVEPE